MATRSANLASQYTGVVANGCTVPTSRVAAGPPTYVDGQFKTPHVSKEQLTQLQLHYPNFFVGSGNSFVEASGGSSAALVEASVEYPTGVYTRILFNGANQGSISAGNILASDLTTLTQTIPSNTLFWVHTWVSMPDRLIYTSEMYLGAQTAIPLAASSVMAPGSAGYVDNTVTYTPIAITAPTRRATVALIGDSRCSGVGDTIDATYSRGYIERALSPSMAVLNLGVSSDAAQYFLASSVKRRSLLQYVSHIVCEYGINDINASRTATQAHADLQSIYALTGVTGKPLWQTTLEPIGVTTTDAYATEANQTAMNSTKNTERVTFNNTLRGGIAGIQGVLDIAPIVESDTTSGKWKALYTTDGAHANKRGALAVQSSGRINASIFAR